MDQDKSKHGIILFDGVCNLCNHVVQFIIPRDRKGYFYFAALQSETGKQLLKQYLLPAHEINTVILIQQGKAYTKSTAALLIARKLLALWPALSIFIVIPKFIRDPFYD